MVPAGANALVASLSEPERSFQADCFGAIGAAKLCVPKAQQLSGQAVALATRSRQVAPFAPVGSSRAATF